MKRAAVSAIATVVLLVAGVASALVVGNDDHKIARSGSTGTTSTSTSTSTTVDIGTATEPSGPPVSIATRLIAASRLEPFRTCGGLVDFARAKALEVVTPYGLPGSGRGRMFAVDGREAFAPQASAGEGSTAGAGAAPAPQSQSAPATASDSAGGPFSPPN